MTRQEAIEWLEDEKDEYLAKLGTNTEAYDMAIEALKQPEQKKGKWIEKPDPYGFFETIPVCSECGCTTKYREKYKCCPNCGATFCSDCAESSFRICPYCYSDLEYQG